MVIETRESLQVVTDNRVSDTARAERAIADALPNGSAEKAEALVRMKLVEFENEANVTGPSATPEPRPVVAAIVTSPVGVLIARRNDGKPPWTFIAGEIEPGESPADAAVREVKEETGLRIRVGSVIGRRVHPRTGRTMIYIAARPTRGTAAFVGDTQELAEYAGPASPKPTS
jgi:ADP-ribose pyrophosphatase YjhB (NUDIX family)